MLHLPVYFVKYAVHGRQLDELLLVFLILAQQPDNGSWIMDPSGQQVLRDVMFHGRKSVPCPTPNMEDQVSICMTQRVELAQLYP